MKKVLYVATVDIHIKTFHLPYLKLLHDNGYEVHVATNGDEQFDYCDKKHQICLERNPFKLDNLKAIGELRKIIGKEKFDLIHCHTPMGAVVARIASKYARKKYGTRVIYTAHGFHFYKGAPIINWILFYPVEKYLAKFTDTLITINKEDYSLAEKKFSKRCMDIKYIPGIGVDDSKFNLNISTKDKLQLMNELGLDKNDFIIIYPARLCCDKNQILLLNFMKKLDNKNIKLLLPGRDEYNGYYQKYVNDNKIKNVFFLGYRDDISKLLSISNLLIATSTREGFGINLVEALASNLPVIAVDNRGHREIIIDGINGFIIQNNLDNLLYVFNMIYTDRNLYDKLRSNSYKSVQKYFLNNSLKEMEIIYDI